MLYRDLPVPIAIGIMSTIALHLQEPEKTPSLGGLCSMVDNEWNRIYILGAPTEEAKEARFLIQDIWAKWPKHSGNKYFPIKAPFWSLKSPAHYYDPMKNFTGRRLKLRKELVEFTLQELRKIHYVAERPSHR